MGVFNSILVPCPDCGTEVEFQSKTGDSCMKKYSIKEMPFKDLNGIIGDSWDCPECGHTIKIIDIGIINASDLVK